MKIIKKMKFGSHVKDRKKRMICCWKPSKTIKSYLSETPEQGWDSNKFSSLNNTDMYL
jgi:hypothetical protein